MSGADDRPRHLVLIGLILYYHVALSWQIVLLPLLIVLIATLALGFGMLGAAVNVRYRDLGVVLPVVIQLWMFLSPVLYPAKLVQDTWPRAYSVYALNPIAGVVNGFRAAILGSSMLPPHSAACCKNAVRMRRLFPCSRTSCI